MMRHDHLFRKNRKIAKSQGKNRQAIKIASAK
jgi:hypothetical protein